MINQNSASLTMSEFDSVPVNHYFSGVPWIEFEETRFLNKGALQIS